MWIRRKFFFFLFFKLYSNQDNRGNLDMDNILGNSVVSMIIRLWLCRRMSYWKINAQVFKGK